MRLAINIDHIATVRNARGEREPDPVEAALICEQAGADGIVIHLREDRRHIRDRDVKMLREIVKTKLDLEMSVNEEIVGIACETKPELATLVPEKREELTTEGGLDVLKNKERVKEVTARLQKEGITVSLFIEPDIEQIDAAKETGADFIEIHTGTFANAAAGEEQLKELEKIKKGARHARKLGLGVNAGHGLDYRNIKLFREVEDVEEVSIGHAIIARALTTGLAEAVKEMRELINTG